MQSALREYLTEATLGKKGQFWLVVQGMQSIVLWRRQQEYKASSYAGVVQGMQSIVLGQVWQ